ncbi:hypothetical protein [Rhodanobacter sp. DHG33]|uniref:hypothetical protein n=1 Tax=Rhodanobacter sp. DHG33 TaxID=2775921 RepID=UPI00177F28F9|nr:hypothetical protein [Rhodanobacter sp. DHG33]MBD8899315.1 hypothetical protein [Rhodanobacter sp. DHG33]
MPAVAHRERVLHALGLVPWQRRQAAGAAPGAMDETPQPVATHADCVVLLPATCGARELDLLGRALTSGGALLARAARVQVRAGDADIAVPQARTYLACGEAQAHALGRSLPMQAMAQAQIVLVDEPARLLGDAAAKRRFWIALRTLRRSLGAGR